MFLFTFDTAKKTSKSINQSIVQSFDQVKPFKVIYQGHITLSPEKKLIKTLVGLLLKLS